MAYTVAIAGTTQHTLKCAQAILAHRDLTIAFVITPTPKPIGRKQIISKNPMQVFANSNHFPEVLIKNKIDEEAKKAIIQFKRPDFLLVVDFGYLVPDWLLNFPQIMPLNIHPSALPKWRGSSPGQFVLLNGETKSAVTIMQMTTKFDQGPIVWQKMFAVKPDWTQKEYYQFSFELAAQELPQVMLELANKKITPQPQPNLSPTPLAEQLTKEKTFVNWEKIKQAMLNEGEAAKKLALQLERASRAYSPWPLLWTKIPTSKGERRTQLISTRLDQKGRLVLEKVKIEGMKIKPWAEVKNMVK